MKLTENSKRVFFNLIKYPEATNKEHANRLNLHESTISKILKKFREDGIINKTYLINVFGLEKGDLIVSNGKFKTKFDLSEKNQIVSDIINPGIPFLKAFDDLYWGVMGYTRNGFSESETKNKQILNKIYDFNRYRFDCDNADIQRFFNYYPIAKKTLDDGLVNDDHDEEIYKKWSLEDLRDVEKNVIKSLIKYPNDSDFRRSRRLDISNPTFTKIRRDLIEREVIIPRYIPDLSVFDFGLISSFWVRLPKSVKNSKKIENICKLDNHIVSLKNDEEIFLLSVFKNLKDLTEHLNQGSQLLAELDIPYNNVNFHYIIYNSPSFNKELEINKLLNYL